MFLFVTVACTDLASPIAAAWTLSSRSIDLQWDSSALGRTYNLRELSTAGTAGATPEGGSTALPQSVTPLASINSSMTNREIIVQATITNVRTPNSERAPYIVSLAQDGTTMSLVFWSDISPPLLPKVKAGSQIRARVTINEYRNQVQLRLRSAANLEVASAAPTTSEPTGTAAPTSALPSVTSAASPAARAKVAIGRIKGDWTDRIVTISGTIAASDNIGSGQRLRVQDGTGEIQAVLWEKVLSGLAGSEFQPGRVITVTGPIRLYRGTVEIVPEVSGDVKLATP
jgi:DNA/RNA endonuclease YhcR with UshA esterase domain